MPYVTTPRGTYRYCVLIPSCGRSDRLKRNLGKMSFLDDNDTIICTHADEKESYAWLDGRHHHWIHLGYPNPEGSVAVVREILRTVAVKRGQYAFYVVTDDNATYTQEALANLVRATAQYAAFVHRPCTCAGMHNTAPHFDRRLIEKTSVTVDGLTTYANVAMIFQCYPHDLYSKYRYPPDAYGLDDRHFYLWAIAQGVRDFRVCMQSPFNKARYQEGGQGDIKSRAMKNGLAIARLATDFPALVGAAGTLRIPWQLILSLESGMTANRLAGGSMRKTEAMVHGTTVKVRRRK